MAASLGFTGTPGQECQRSLRHRGQKQSECEDRHSLTRLNAARYWREPEPYGLARSAEEQGTRLST